MNDIHDVIVKRLNKKKEELEDRQYQFDIMWQNERNSGTFECNAINDFLLMYQLRSQIEELEHLEIVTRCISK